MRRLALAIALMLPGCCTSCGGAPRAGGPTPYARCAAADPPPAREARVGALTLRLEGRELAIEGLPERVPIALARGPAPFRDPLAPGLAAIAGSGARLLLIAGALGDDEATLVRNVTALGQLEIPTLVLAGGRDDPDQLRAALDGLEPAARDRVIDVSALRRVRLGGRLVLVPAAGAPAGRYARTDETCGIGEDDVEEIAGALGAPEDGETRILFAWAAPAGHPASRGLEGGDAGSSEIARLREALGARGALVGWPEAHAGAQIGDVAVAAPLAGPAVVRTDGSRAPAAPLLVELGPAGIAAPDSP